MVGTKVCMRISKRFYGNIKVCNEKDGKVWMGDVQMGINRCRSYFVVEIFENLLPRVNIPWLVVGLDIL